MQIETLTCGGAPLYLLHGALTEAQCGELAQMIEPVTEKQTILKLPAIRDKLWEFIRPGLAQITHPSITGLEESITITKTYNGLGRHRDNGWEKGGWKLAFYLNDLKRDGGTNFYEHGEIKVRVQNKMGSGILFPMQLEHESQPVYRPERKLMIGARPILG